VIQYLSIRTTLNGTGGAPILFVEILLSQLLHNPLALFDIHVTEELYTFQKTA